jgi:hypothetical protein
MVEVLKKVDWILGHPDDAGAGVPTAAAEAHTAWVRFQPVIRRVSVALVVFEAWNLAVILISLGGFAHLPALTGAAWASVTLWIVELSSLDMAPPTN